jgi:hypothetical protein
MDEDLKKDYERLSDLVDRFRTRTEQKKSTIETKKKLDQIIAKIKTNMKEYDRETRKEIRLCISEYESTRDSSLLFELHEKEIGESKLKTNDELLTDAQATSKKTTQQLKEGLSKLNECEQIGTESMITIKIDNEKLKKINETVDHIDTDLQISQKLLNRFLKRIYTDKLIWCFLCIIILLIIVIVLAKYQIITF